MKKIALSFVLVCAMLFAAMLCISADTIEAKYIVLGTTFESVGEQGGNWVRLEEFNVNAAKEYKIGDVTVAQGQSIPAALDKAAKLTITDNLGSHGTPSYNEQKHLIDGIDRNNSAAFVFAENTFMKKISELTSESPFVDQGITAYIQYEFDQVYSLESYDISFQGVNWNLNAWKVLASTDGVNWTVVDTKTETNVKDIYGVAFTAPAAPATTTAAPATTTAAPAATTAAPAATTVTAAQTSDIALVMALGLLVVAGLAYTASKKSR